VPQGRKQVETDGDADGRVGNIERWPVMRADMKVEEVGDPTKFDAVNEIAEDSADGRASG